MGQKVNPHGARVGVIKDWSARWFANKKDFSNNLVEDHALRTMLKEKLFTAGISHIDIERASNKVTVNIFTAKPGIVIGRGGAGAEALKKEIEAFTGKAVSLNILEIKQPEADAQLVAEKVAQSLEKRVSFRRAMKRAMQSAMRMGIEGVKIQCGGRLGGAEIARVEKYAEGRVPLHTLRADIDYATATAKTVYGAVGIKVWIMHGEKIGKDVLSSEPKREK